MSYDVSLNLATVRRQWKLPQAVMAAARHGFAGVAPWRDMVQETGVAEAARILRGSGLRVTGYCRGGLFAAAGADGLSAAIDDNRRVIDEAATIGAECVVVIGGGLAPGSRDLPAARKFFAEGLAAVLPHARACNVPLALEPLHPMYAADRGCITTLKEMLDIIDVLGNDGRANGGSGDDGCGDDGLGIAIDTYHVWWDPELAAQIARAGGRIIAHHICDWLVPTKDLLNDRGMMGDGVIDFPAIRAMIEAAGYRGIQEIEIFSEDWWSRPGDEVLATAIDRFKTVCCAAV
jgi:sugar phosphate isomerase/epimerase